MQTFFVINVFDNICKCLRASYVIIMRSLIIHGPPSFGSLGVNMRDFSYPCFTSDFTGSSKRTDLIFI